jgi:hypothetical protein
LSLKGAAQHDKGYSRRQGLTPAKVGTTSGGYETQAPRYKAKGRVNGKNERKAGAPRGREKRGREFQDINIT